MKYHLAQINIGTLLAPIDDPMIAGFVNRLDEINALAERSPGFVWRLKDDSGNATNIHVFNNPLLIVNMSVWESPEALKAFTYQSDHVEVFKERAMWFHKSEQAHLALWWIPEGHVPDALEGKARVEYLQARGESEYAFTFRTIPSPPVPWTLP